MTLTFPAAGTRGKDFSFRPQGAFFSPCPMAAWGCPAAHTPRQLRQRRTLAAPHTSTFRVTSASSRAVGSPPHTPQGQEGNKAQEPERQATASYPHRRLPSEFQLPSKSPQDPGGSFLWQTWPPIQWMITQRQEEVHYGAVDPKCI